MEALKRIEDALHSAVAVLEPFIPGATMAEHKSDGRGPVTEADRAVDRILRKALIRNNEGWLSEESVDNLERLRRKRIWVVDPLDGTREFVEGVPEWCVSIALVEDGRAVAGGICNPATGESILGSRDTGVSYNRRPAKTTGRTELAGATVLASRTEVGRGEWQQFESAPFSVRPVGSVAYKLGLVAAGLADATWTLSPKNEWDVAAGVALVEAAGGFAVTLEDSHPEFNRKSPLLSGLIAAGRPLRHQLKAFLDSHIRVTASNESRGTK